jgi:hypothetical protein
MKKQTVIATISTAALLSLGVTSAFAQRPLIAQSGTAASGAAAQKTEQRITDAKGRADNEIARRIASLNALIARINDMKKLSADSKSTLTSQIQSEVTSLTALKAKVDADTDIATLKTDIQSIVADFRIYALFIPKTHILSGADLILQATDTFADIQTKLAAKITEAQTAGKDTTALTASLTDMQSQVTNAKQQANNAVATVTPLIPDKTTNYTPALQTARISLQTARKDLDNARKDARAIISGLKGPKDASSSSQSATTR